MRGARLRLVLAAALFLGWMGWLVYTATSKSRGPVVSRAAAAAATEPIVAAVQAGALDLEGKAGDRVRVIEALRPGGPEKGTSVEVANLPDADGYVGAGTYLLLLRKDAAGYAVVGRPRGAGDDRPAGKPVIYPWGDVGVKAQARALFR